VTEKREKKTGASRELAMQQIWWWRTIGEIYQFS
jgi:hypothetical protein